jgi:hypothetical protein
MVEISTNLVDEAKKAKVKHIVKQSAFGSDIKNVRVVDEPSRSQDRKRDLKLTKRLFHHSSLRQ